MQGRVNPSPPAQPVKTWEEISAEYPIREPEFSYWIIANAPGKCYRRLMHGLIPWKTVMEIRDRVICHLRAHGPFTDRRIFNKIIYLNLRGWEVKLGKDDVFMEEFPFVQWNDVLCRYHWILRWYN